MSFTIRGETLQFQNDREIAPATWDKFFQGACWQDIINSVNLRLVMVRDELEKVVGDEATFARGEAATLRFFLNLEEIIKEECKPKKENEDG